MHIFLNSFTIIGCWYSTRDGDWESKGHISSETKIGMWDGQVLASGMIFSLPILMFCILLFLLFIGCSLKIELPLVSCMLLLSCSSYRTLIDALQCFVFFWNDCDPSNCGRHKIASHSLLSLMVGQKNIEPLLSGNMWRQRYVIYICILGLFIGLFHSTFRLGYSYY